MTSGRWVFAMTCWLFAAHAWADEELELRVGVGMQRPLDIHSAKRISVGAPQIADVRIMEGDIVVSGHAVGRTSLLVWKRSGDRLTYKVVVVSDGTREGTEEVRIDVGAQKVLD